MLQLLQYLVTRILPYSMIKKKEWVSFGLLKIFLPDFDADFKCSVELKVYKKVWMPCIELLAIEKYCKDVTIYNQTKKYQPVFYVFSLQCLRNSTSW